MIVRGIKIHSFDKYSPDKNLVYGPNAMREFFGEFSPPPERCSGSRNVGHVIDFSLDQMISTKRIYFAFRPSDFGIRAVKFPFGKKFFTMRVRACPEIFSAP